MLVRRTVNKTELERVLFVFRAIELLWASPPSPVIVLDSVTCETRPTARHRKWSVTYTWCRVRMNQRSDRSDCPKVLPDQAVVDSVIAEVRDSIQYLPPGKKGASK